MRQKKGNMVKYKFSVLVEDGGSVWMNNCIFYRLLGFWGSCCLNHGLQGCYTIWHKRLVSTFLKYRLPPCSGWLNLLLVDARTPKCRQHVLPKRRDQEDCDLNYVFYLNCCCDFSSGKAVMSSWSAACGRELCTTVLICSRWGSLMTGSAAPSITVEWSKR